MAVIISKKLLLVEELHGPPLFVSPFLHVILKLDIFYHCAEGLDVIDQNASYLIFSLMILITFRFAE